MIKEVVVIKFSHRTQYLITTSVDIMFINLTTEYYVQKQLLLKSMSRVSLPRDIFFFFSKRMFSCCPLFRLTWKVVAIRFSHRKQRLNATGFDIVPSVPLFYFFLRLSLHLIQIFVFIIPQYRKDDFITKRKQFIKTVFFKAILSLIY